MQFRIKGKDTIYTIENGKISPKINKEEFFSLLMLGPDGIELLDTLEDGSTPRAYFLKVNDREKFLDKIEDSDHFIYTDLSSNLYLVKEIIKDHFVAVGVDDIDTLPYEEV